MKTLLMISYCYPPMGSPGALRSSKFAKFLPELGWHPIVVTPRAGYSRVMGLPVEMPGVKVVRTGDAAWAKRTLASAARSGSAGGWKHRAARALHTLAIPDRDVTWYPAAVRAGLRAARRDGTDAIYSTSPSVTNHLVARRLSIRLGIPWVADFRDPWTLAPQYHQPAWRARIDRALERRIVRQASYVVVVSEYIAEQFAVAYPEHAHKFSVIRNAFDPADFPGAPSVHAAGDRFVLAYAGGFYSGGRDPRPLFQALRSLSDAGEITPRNFCLELIGGVEPAVQRLADELDLGQLVEFVGQLPYADAVARLGHASALLTLTHTGEHSRGEMTTKFFDYLGVGRPQLVLAPESFEIAGLVRGHALGAVIDPRDSTGIAHWIRQAVGGSRSSRSPEAGLRDLSAFTRRAAAARLAGLLDRTLH